MFNLRKQKRSTMLDTLLDKIPNSLFYPLKIHAILWVDLAGDLRYDLLEHTQQRLDSV